MVIVARGQGTAFNYQGRLNDNGAPANGNYDLRFTVYDSSVSAVIVAGPITNSTTSVSNGLFAATLDFGAGVFSGSPRWLEIAVRTNSAGVFVPLNPRQALTPSPYAIYSDNAATATIASNVASGTVVGTLNGLRDNVMLQAGSNVTITPSGNSLTIASTGVGGNGIWSVLNNNTYYNAGNVGIGTTAPSLYGHGGTGRILEINNSGTAMHSQSHLILYTAVNSIMDSAMGSVTWAQPGGMAAYIGAHTRSTTPNSPSATLTFGTRKAGDGGPSPRMVITEDGNVGIGTILPAAGVRLDISGTARVSAGGSGGFLSLAAPNGETGLGAIGVNRFDLRFDGHTLKLAAGPGTSPPPAQYGITINTNGNVGVGMASPLIASQWKLDVNGPMRVTPGGSGGAVQFSAPNGESGMGIIGANRADLRFDGSTLKLVAGAGNAPPSSANGIAVTTDGNVGIGTTTPNAKLQVEGNAIQPPNQGGFVKAMAYIDPFRPAGVQYVVRCYNSQQSGNGVSTAPCGITVIKTERGRYKVDFGFDVRERFFSVTLPFSVGYVSARPTGNAAPTVVVVEIWQTEGFDFVDQEFTIFVF